jgi:cyclase
MLAATHRFAAPLPHARWLAGPGRTRTRFREIATFREGLYDLGLGCHAWMVPNGSWGETNLGLIVCGKQSVLIDTCWDLPYTQEMLRICQPVLSRAPIELVINTHADGDHCWGNQLFEGREIIASHACVHQMHHLSPGAMRAMQRSALLMKHLPLGHIDTLGHYMHDMLAPYDFGGVRVKPASCTFSKERHLCVGGVDLVLTEVGPGHTDGDVIVHVPDRHTVYAGDILFVGVTPVMWAGPVANLVAALQHLLDLRPQMIVPGHGPLATPADVRAAIDYWGFLQEALTPRHRAGLTPEEAVRDVLRSATFLATPFARWQAPERMLTNAYALYREWGTVPSSLGGKLAQLDLMRRQARIAQTWQALCTQA